MLFRVVGSSLVFALAVSACDVEERPEDQVGLNQSAIVNGQVNQGDPALALITMQVTINGEKQPFATCSGTLVAPRTVLTARHCVRAEQETAVTPEGYVFPAEDLLVQFATQPTADDPTYAVVKHEFHAEADIAVLELAEDGPAVPVAMNTVTLDDQVGNIVRIAGFGITASGSNDSGTKRTGISTLLALDSGGVNFGELAITGLEEGAEAPESKLCSGDSGGPTFMTIGGVEVQIGVNSFVARPIGVPGSGPPQCQDATTVNGEVRVDVYNAWIQEFIDRNATLADEAKTDDAISGPVTGGGCSATADSGSCALMLLALLVLLRRRALV